MVGVDESILVTNHVKNCIEMYLDKKNPTDFVDFVIWNKLVHLPVSILHYSSWVTQLILDAHLKKVLIYKLVLIRTKQY